MCGGIKYRDEMLKNAEEEKQIPVVGVDEDLFDGEN